MACTRMTPRKMSSAATQPIPAAPKMRRSRSLSLGGEWRIRGPMLRGRTSIWRTSVRHDGGDYRAAGVRPHVELSTMIRAYLRGAFRRMRAVLPATVRCRRGRTINMSFQLARTGAATAWIIGFTRSLTKWRSITSP